MKKVFWFVVQAQGSVPDAELAANGAKKASKKQRPRDVVAKQYSPEFMWGQLVSWYKQTIYNPSASLSADRRGTFSLPSIDSCYVQVGGY